MRDEQRRNAGVIHSDPHAVTGDPGLADLEERASDLIAVTDAHLVVGESFDGEVLGELPVHEVASAKLALPIPVRLDLVDEHRTHLASMPGEIALSVAFDVELADSA